MDVLFVLALRARFEDLNADVRWTSACRQLDGGSSLILLSFWKAKCNKSGRYLREAKPIIEKGSTPSGMLPYFFIHALDSIPKILPG